MSTDHPSQSFSRVLVSIGICACWLSGCGDPVSDTKPSGESAGDHFGVRVDRSENGAALEGPAGHTSDSIAPPREFAFSVVGSAPVSTTLLSPEGRSAASQAAIIEALGSAIRETRKARGRSTTDFTAKIGDRLTFTQKTDGDSREITVCLTYRGVENTIIVRDGVLRQPPVDFRLIRQLFAETNGEFSLLGTDRTSPDGVVLATVGCYVPAGFSDELTPRNIAQGSLEEP